MNKLKSLSMDVRLASVSQIGRLLMQVDYPSYELYTEPLREGIWNEVQGKQLRLVVDKDRKIKEVQEL